MGVGSAGGGFEQALDGVTVLEPAETADGISQIESLLFSSEVPLGSAPLTRNQEAAPPPSDCFRGQGAGVLEGYRVMGMFWKESGDGCTEVGGVTKCH